MRLQILVVQSKKIVWTPAPSMNNIFQFQQHSWAFASVQKYLKKIIEKTRAAKSNYAHQFLRRANFKISLHFPKNFRSSNYIFQCVKISNSKPPGIRQKRPGESAGFFKFMYGGAVIIHGFLAMLSPGVTDGTRDQRSNVKNCQFRIPTRN